MFQNEVSNDTACWRQFTHRGMPEKASICPEGMKLSSTYCYSDCPAGWDSENGACFKQCPKGTEQGLHTCKRPASVERKVSSVKCDGCHQEGLHWFHETCPSGYMPSYTGHCTAPCPEGSSDAGHLGCLRKYAPRSYSRAGCPEGSHSQGFMCWKGCPKGTHRGVGPLCWESCPADTHHPCLYGTLCVGNHVSCAQFTHDLENEVALSLLGLDFKNTPQKDTSVGALINNKDFGACPATV